MPKKLQPQKMASITIRVTPGQAKDIDFMVLQGRFGSTRPEIVKYFLMRQLEQFSEPAPLKWGDRNAIPSDSQG